MLNWVKSLFRRAVTVGMQAGVYDVLMAGRGGPALSDEEAAAALLAMIAASPAAAGLPGTTTLAGPAQPQLPGPAAPSLMAPTDEPRRGPGRPRKLPPEEPVQ